MSSLSSILLFAAEEEHHLAPLIMPPVAFAGIAAAIFVILAFVTHSHRDISNRHSDKVPADGDAHGSHH